MSPRIDVLVEIQVDGAWVDITDDVRTEGKIVITRGRRDEGTTVDWGKCALSINNKLGVYSPRVPTSPYYGKIGRNTPLRVSVDGDVRFVGEISAWPIRWDVTGSDIYEPLEAAGILRRLGQGAKPLFSPLRRALSVDPNLVAYWPLEDEVGATTMASGLTGAPPMRVIGSPEFGAFSDIAGSAPLPTMKTAAFSGTVPGHTNTGYYQLRFFAGLPDSGTTTQRLISLYTAGSGSQSHRWDLRYINDAFDGEVLLRLYDEEENLLNETAAQVPGINGHSMYFTVELEQSGSDVHWAFFGFDAITREYMSGLDWLVDGAFTNRTIYDVLNVTVAGFRALGDVAFGHVALANAPEGPDFPLMTPMLGHAGELAGRRIQRLMAENGLYFEAAGDLSDTPPMGAQRVDTLLALVADCEAVDGGIFHELRTEVGTAYRPASSIYNQVPTS